MAVGALFGFQLDKFGFSASFMLNLVFMGAIWGALWSAGLAIRNSKNFWKVFKSLRQHKGYVRMRMLTLAFMILIGISAFVFSNFKLELLGLALLCFVMSNLTIFVKSVELSCMHKWVYPDKLTEGDWLVHAVKIGKHKIIPPRLGLEKKDVKILQTLYKQKKINKVLVRYGVPFTPAFLLAYIFTLGFGNLFLAILTAL